MLLVTFFSSLQGDTGSPGPPGLPGTVSKIDFGAVTIFKVSLHFLHINSSETIFKCLTSLQKLWDLFTLGLSPFVPEKQYQGLFGLFIFSVSLYLPLPLCKNRPGIHKFIVFKIKMQS